MYVMYTNAITVCVGWSRHRPVDRVDVDLDDGDVSDKPGILLQQLRDEVGRHSPEQHGKRTPQCTKYFSRALGCRRQGSAKPSIACRSLLTARLPTRPLAYPFLHSCQNRLGDAKRAGGQRRKRTGTQETRAHGDAEGGRMLPRETRAADASCSRSFGGAPPAGRSRLAVSPGCWRPQTGLPRLPPEGGWWAPAWTHARTSICARTGYVTRAPRLTSASECASKHCNMLLTHAARSKLSQATKSISDLDFMLTNMLLRCF